MRLLHLNKATSISLIKKYHKGLPNRLQHYDDWVKSWKDPHIHSYFDYFYNGEVRKYQMYMPNSQKAKEVKDTVDYNFRPGLADISRQYSLADQNYADDLELAEDIQKITLKSFFKGFRDSQTRTEIQRLALWLPIFLVTISIVLYLSVIKADDVPDTAQLEPHESYFHYRAPQMKQRVVAQIEKIHFLDKHAREVLLQAKKKALQSKQQK